MMLLTVLAHLAVAFCGFLFGTIVTCVLLVKKNGKRYAQIKEEVRNRNRVPETGNYELEDDTEADSDTDLD